MKSSLIIAAACSAFALSGCVIAIDGNDDDHISTSFTANGAGYSSVYAADVEANAVSFIVTDNGCTDESFFDVDVRKTGENTFTLGLDRVRQDHCKAYNPDGQNVRWTFRALGIPEGAEISILNGVRR